MPNYLLINIDLCLSLHSITQPFSLSTGCIITYLTKLLGDHGINCIGFSTDINPHANLCTQQTANQNSIGNIEVVRCDFAAPLQENLRGKVDVLLFNPPYVPTPNHEVGGTNIAASWAGGEDGRLVIDRFLPTISILLSKSGVCYMVLVQDNKPKDLCKILKNRYHLSMSVIKRHKARNEQLMIAKIVNI